MTGPKKPQKVDLEGAGVPEEKPWLQAVHDRRA
jgi:hypothetical protein